MHLPSLVLSPFLPLSQAEGHDFPPSLGKDAALRADLRPGFALRGSRTAVLCGEVAAREGSGSPFSATVTVPSVWPQQQPVLGRRCVFSSFGPC